MRKALKTKQVEQAVFRSILYGEYNPGDKLPTEREMAEQTGTSRITVRQAYAELAAQGILLRVQGRGTIIRKIAQGNTELLREVALLTSLRERFALEFVETLEAELAARGCVLVLKVTGDDPKREEEAAISLVASGIRNLVLWPSGAGLHAATFARLRILGVNMVFFDRMLPGSYADFVGLDNAHAVKTLLAGAKESGFSAYHFLTYNDLPMDSNRLREETFLSICQRENLPHAIHRISVTDDAVEVLQSHKQTWFGADCPAVLSVNDTLAVSARKAFGADMPLYSIDGSDEAIRAGIVSYSQPMRKMAAAAADRLFHQRQEGVAWTPQHLFFKGKLHDPA